MGFARSNQSPGHWRCPLDGPNSSPNPRRVAAGRRNREKWLGIGAAGLERLAAAALARRPWEKATGPRTAEGKVRSAENGRSRQKGVISIRQLKAGTAETHALILGLRAAVKAITDRSGDVDQDEGHNTEVNCA